MFEVTLHIINAAMGPGVRARRGLRRLRRQGAGSRKAGRGGGGGGGGGGEDVDDCRKLPHSCSSPTVLAQDISMTGNNKDGVAVNFGVKI